MTDHETPLLGPRATYAHAVTLQRSAAGGRWEACHAFRVVGERGWFSSRCGFARKADAEAWVATRRDYARLRNAEAGLAGARAAALARSRRALAAAARPLAVPLATAEPVNQVDPFEGIENF